ncbi:aminoglycoside phosphotransferase family protein [Kitasatospora sp. NPDC048365]|uniref:aminoglycoside phosphotransferase family protein n=1 Tax=Kitasatospora sp. NPDC048365 TaxID=3364050 RepID=UPI0037135ED5
MVPVPEEFTRTTVGREGPAGAAWLAELPALVDRLLLRWDCAPDGEVLHGGVGLVVPVRSAHGPAAIKVSFPHPGNVHEPDALQAWGGDGAVRLYARDDARYAMLLERAHPTTLAAVADGDEVPETAGRLSRRLAVPAPPGLPRLSAQADGWEEQLRKDAAEFPQALPARVVDAAVATVRELGREQPATLVHGDLHARNILRAEREPWLAVDPKGLAGDPAYDAGTLLKSRAVALLGADDLPGAVRRTLAVFTDAAELDPHRTVRWAQFHGVQAAYHGRRHGFRIARSGPGLDWLTAFADRLAAFLTDEIP